MGEPGTKFPPIWCQECGRVYDAINCPRYCDCVSETSTDYMEIAPAWRLELAAKLADVLQRHEVLSANNERLAEAKLKLHELLECKDQLLACYRMNRRPPEKLLSRLAELNAEVLGGQS